MSANDLPPDLLQTVLERALLLDREHIARREAHRALDRLLTEYLAAVAPEVHRDLRGPRDA